MKDLHPFAKKVPVIILATLFIAAAAYAVWGGYELRLSNKSIEDLQTKNKTYADENATLKELAASSTAAFDDLYQTLTKAIQEEGFKNKTLEEKVQSLDKLTKADPQLLKKYSKVYFLNENYRPTELQTIVSGYVVNKKNEYQIHVDVMYFLIQMIDDARKEGVNPLVVSAFRSFETQAALKTQNKVVYGANTANRFVAEQGYSEHQLGTTLDFSTASIAAANMSFEKTKEFEWLQNNAYKYGFILSYPKGNAYYAYEPWHWRFVGKALALQMHQDGIGFYNLDQRFIDGYLVNMFDR